MKIVFMEADTLGKDVDLSEFDKLGEVVKYPASKPAENAKRIEDADIIIVNKIPVNEELLKEAKNVKLVCVTATGTNIVDMPYVESRGIVVTNVKGYSTMSVAQHTFALLFYVYEKLAYYDRFVKSGTYAKSDVFSHFAKPFHELDGKVYGIIGMGAIGEKVAEIDRRLGEKFGKHPGVILWHISNEFGGECHCPLCQEKFREWLEKKYGMIENLNSRWCTTFWSHRYQSFSQIESPSSLGENELHALKLDWKRFVTEQTVDFMKAEIAALRETGTEIPVTTNLMYDYDGLDYKKFREDVDIISWDNYPGWHKKEEWLTATDAGMQHDLMRSIRKAPFLMMESCPSATNWKPINKLKKPGMLLAASLQAIAHGSDSVLYFQLRQSQGASEKFHGAVIDHYGGNDTRVFREVTEVGEALEKLQEVTGSVTCAKAAVLYDRENDWALKDAQGPRNDMHYQECVLKQYRALRAEGLDVDVISMEHALSDYKILAVPMTYLFSEKYEERLREYVAQGGTLVLTYWSGLVDETDKCFLGGTPYGLMDVTGVRSTEIDALFDWESNHGIPEHGNRLGLQKVYECKNLCELSEVSDAEVLMRYADDFYAGSPLVTHKAYGEGHAYYVGADMEQAFYDDLFKGVAEEAGVKSLAEAVPEGVSVNVRQSENAEYLFIQNFSRKEVVVPVTGEYQEIYGTGSEVLAPLQTRVLKFERK